MRSTGQRLRPLIAGVLVLVIVGVLVRGGNPLPPAGALLVVVAVVGLCLLALSRHPPR